MATDLEQRRLAIVHALRAVMAEPLPQAEARVDVRSHPEMSDAPAGVAVDHGSAAVDPSENVERPPRTVPPFEGIGSMSKVASLALFGHA